jgi:5-formyltetrahydrofolate cyclo-ligase
VSAPGRSAGKRRWRRWAREQRRRIEWSPVSDAIVGRLRDWGRLSGRSRVLLYDPLPDEADLTPLAGDVVALLTRTADDGDLTIHPFESRRERHPLGFGQPVAGSASVDPATVDVALVPGLAFDGSGVRLGRGGGHYDRLLPRLRADALIVGVVPEALVVDRLPADAHDVPVTHLVTERRIVEVGSVSVMTDPLVAAAREWIAGDPDHETRGALRALLDAGDL